MKLRLISSLPEYIREAEEIVRAFSPYVVVSDDAVDYLELSAEKTDCVFHGKISSSFQPPVEVDYEEEDYLLFKKLSKRAYKNALYRYMVSLTGLSLPYGSLTGVRPTKLLYEAEKSGLGSSFLTEEFFVSEEKASLIKSVVDNQRGIYSDADDIADVYVNIPFCPTRCNYCSFISSEYKRIEKRISEYRDAVVQEIRSLRSIISARSYNIRSVYVGGGTPSVLPPDILDAILAELRGLATEFTVECGRPDTITEALADVLVRNGVTRCSVNPQSFFDETLIKIGRKHTIEDFYKAYDILNSRGLSVNIDLIAGLTDETPDMFRHSLDSAIALAPDNITVHSLSLKRGSRITEEGQEKARFGAVSDMLSYAHDVLPRHGYAPYYMYRQKNSADNLENTGYALPGKQCVYNIDIMEEIAHVLSAGAGGMSKRLERSSGKILRYSIPKGFEEYLARIEEIIGKKEEFFNGKQ